MKTWTKVAMVLFGLFFWAMVVNGVYDAFSGVLPAQLSYYESEDTGQQLDAAGVAFVLGGIGFPLWLIYSEEWVKELRAKARAKEEEESRAWLELRRDRGRQESDD